jgi:hypothetical protein
MDVFNYECEGQMSIKDVKLQSEHKGDLISRKAAIQVIENLCTDGNMYGNQNLTLIDAYEAIDGISDLHTAYDVDKVVEQINHIMKDENIRFANQVVQRAANIVKGVFNDDER